MGLLSFLKRRPGADAGAASPVESTDEVQLARTRARRRLIGASVLVIAGVVGFPLVFETQPRPVPVDIPIEIPRKEAAAPLPLPPARKPSATPVVPPVPQPASAARAEPAEIATETAADAGRDVTTPPKPAAAASKPATVATSKPAPTAVAEAPRKPASSAAPSAAEAQRAQALLDGRSVARDAARPATTASEKDVAKDTAKDAGRFVVQVGAFADAAAARETRGKAERLGLKTYTQVVETASGSRIRVRAGPYASRDEADKAMARAKAAGLNAVVLTL